MTCSRAGIVPAALLAGVFLLSCKSPDEKRALAISRAAGSEKQRELWRQAAEDGRAAGLDELPVPQQAVTSVPIATQPEVTPSPAPPEVVLPASITAGLRLTAAPRLGLPPFRGKARVLGFDGQKLELQLPSDRLVVHLRLPGTSPRLEPGEDLELDYRRRIDRRGSELQVSAVAPSGDVFGWSSLGDTKPARLEMKLLKLTAEQVAGPGEHPEVAVRVGATRKTLSAGQTESFPNASGLKVRIDRSDHDEDPRGSDPGLPYTLAVIAWK